MLKTLFALFASLVLATSAQAGAITLSHALPQSSPMIGFLEEWAGYVADGSDSQLSITLEETSGDLLAKVESGELALALVKPSDMSQRFHPVEVFELPLTALDHVAASQAAFDYLEEIQQEAGYAGPKILSVWLDVLTFELSEEVRAKIKTPQDLQAMFLNPDVYRGTAYILVMNSDAYDSLALDLQSVLDENTGKALAEFAASAMEDAVQPGQVILKAQTIASLPPEAQALLQQFSAPKFAAWVERAKTAGVDGFAAFEKAGRLIEANQ